MSTPVYKSSVQRLTRGQHEAKKGEKDDVPDQRVLGTALHSGVIWHVIVESGKMKEKGKLEKK